MGLKKKCKTKPQTTLKKRENKRILAGYKSVRLCQAGSQGAHRGAAQAEVCLEVLKPVHHCRVGSEPLGSSGVHLRCI